ncbi:hypothetical protein ANOM_009327 [Aspergillus terreus]|uniref:Uncharacterized protein n=1 Tax=Aspergillus terreus TaxID=33178 RepID=A0A5M3Z961_ASPTE|nr:hypothetical protein ATETN484_0012013800 [Aspergillus terreus]GFF19386.1 hypothetical protein ANOM_009327 [Aspergillus terreus]
MKLSYTSIICLFAGTSWAAAIDARQTQQVTVALSNDRSGAYASVSISPDGTDKSISALFGGTSVGATGSVLASSAQLASFPPTIKCVIVNGGATIATLTAQKTYVDLDGNPAVANPVNLSGGVLRCSV